MEALKLCPHCGSPAQLSECADYVTIFCTGCEAGTHPIYGLPDNARREYAIAAWNKRI